MDLKLSLIAAVLCHFKVIELSSASSANPVPGPKGGERNMTVVSRECISEPDEPEFGIPPHVCYNRKNSCKHEVVSLSNHRTILCDTETDGGGWIVIQRQLELKSALFVEAGEAEYVAGFGHVNGSFWIGLDSIHRLCSPKKMPCQLRIEASIQGKEHVLAYGNFSVSGGFDKYRLTVRDAEKGPAADLLQANNGRPFITKDTNAKDTDAIKCVTSPNLGGWWYGKDCNLPFNAPTEDVENRFTYTEIKIRRDPPKNAEKPAEKPAEKKPNITHETRPQ